MTLQIKNKMADGGQKINQIVQFDEKSHQKVSFTYLFKHYLEAKDYVRLTSKNRVILNIIVGSKSTAKRGRTGETYHESISSNDTG